MVLHEEQSNVQMKVTQREKRERLALAALTTETLNNLNISINALPQKHKDLISSLSKLKAELNIDLLDSIAISQIQTKQISENLSRENELFELRQKNVKLQKEIDRNKKFLEGMREELKSAKELLTGQNPNPENIQEHVRQVKQKLLSYEEIYEKAKRKYTKLQVPEHLLPKALEELSQRLTALKEEERTVRQRADDVTLARQARETLSMLRR